MIRDYPVMDENPPLDKALSDWNRRAVIRLQREPDVKYATVGRMGTGKWFYEVELYDGRMQRGEYETQADLAIAIGHFLAEKREGKNPGDVHIDISDTHNPDVGRQGPFPDTGITPAQAKRSAAEWIRGAGFAAVKVVSAKTISFMDLARRNVVMVYLEGFMPESDWFQLKLYARDHGYLVHLQEEMSNPPMPHSALMEIVIALSVVRETYSGRRDVSELEKAIRLLENGIEKLRSSHKGKTDWHNPPATEIYRHVLEIRAEKKDGKRYVHKFGRGSGIFGLPDGTILIASRKGKKLWKNFEQGR
jgi:hypothetical protein